MTETRRESKAEKENDVAAAAVYSIYSSALLACTRYRYDQHD